MRGRATFGPSAYGATFAFSEPLVAFAALPSPASLALRFDAGIAFHDRERADAGVALERDALLGAIRKASVMAGDEMRSIRLQLDKTTLNLSARVEGRGQAKTANVEAEVEGESSLMVDYNPDFLIDFLKPLKSETVVLEFRDANSAAVLKTGAADEVYVVMPITTN